jgi:hypothetical protein
MGLFKNKKNQVIQQGEPSEKELANTILSVSQKLLFKEDVLKEKMRTITLLENKVRDLTIKLDSSNKKLGAILSIVNNDK